MDFQSEKSFEKAETESVSNHTIKFYVCRSMSKMSKMDQIHLRAVMLCMSKMSKIDQIHLRAVMHMLCMSKMLKMHSIECIEYCTKDQSNVEDVEDRSNTAYRAVMLWDVGDVD